MCQTLTHGMKGGNKKALPNKQGGGESCSGSYSIKVYDSDLGQ